MILISISAHTKSLETYLILVFHGPRIKAHTNKVWKLI